MENSTKAFPDLICFSHLRWNFVFQRPQHLMTHFAQYGRVFYFEEPIYDNKEGYALSEKHDNLFIIQQHLPEGLDETEVLYRQKDLLKVLMKKMDVKEYIIWYYTPMALPLGDELKPELVIYDCMDELSGFLFAPPSIKKLEQKLLMEADIVFTGGKSLYKARKEKYASKLYLFPSSIDINHFIRSRYFNEEMPDQKAIPKPRIGFSGVIDERMNLDLMEQIASLKPDWNFVMIGPVVKIDVSTLPILPNIHYLDIKPYDDLPSYFAGWDIAMMPFALNDSTRFISPTKTPEYLAAGRPVISTSIPDVVEMYGRNKLVHIADTAEEFIEAINTELNQSDKSLWLEQVDLVLSDMSWNKTFLEMKEIITNRISLKNNVNGNTIKSPELKGAIQNV